MNQDAAVLRKSTSKPWVSIWILVLLIVSLIVCIPWILYFRNQTMVLREKLAAVHREMETVDEEIAEYESLRERAEVLRAGDRLLSKQMNEVLTSCRTADDVPILAGEFVAAATHTLRTNSIAANFYVPCGKHRLEVEFLDASAKKLAPFNFECELCPETGYRLEIVGNDSDQTNRLDRLVLSCRNKDFDTVSKALPFDELDIVSLTSWGLALEDIAFPSEVCDRLNTQNYLPGVMIMRCGLSGKNGTPNLRVTAWVRSDAPPCANPNDAYRMQMLYRLQSSDQLRASKQEVTYVGGGKFDLPGFQLSPSN